MSSNKMNDLKKVDVSFYNGYTDYRGEYRKYILIHLFQVVMFTIFIPIDSLRLTVGDRVMTALIVGLADAGFSLLSMAYIYYSLFVEGDMRKYLYMAHKLNHMTNEQGEPSRTIEDCTSATMLYQPDGITIVDLDDKTIKVYSNIAKLEIAAQLEQLHTNLSSLVNVYKFLSILSMILIIAFMIMSKNMNPAEIAILTIFLVLQAYLKITLFVLLILIALSPVICIVGMFYCCFCMPKNEAQGQRILNLVDRAALTSDVVKSGGQCSVCLMDIKQGQSIFQLPCSQKHIFHKGCLMKWSMVSFTCPHCRAALPTASAQKGLQLAVGAESN